VVTDPVDPLSKESWFGLTGCHTDMCKAAFSHGAHLVRPQTSIAKWIKSV